MTKRNIRAVWGIVGAIAMLAGCGGGDAAPDGAIATGDGSADGVDTVEWTVSGGRSGGGVYDGDSNYVSCLESGSLFSVTGSNFAGGSEGFNFIFEQYTGPGTYETVYSTGRGNPSVSVRLSGGYNYWYFYNRASIDLSIVNSSCTLIVRADPLDESRVEGTISCADLASNITSPDYDDETPAGYRPSVSLLVDFDCEI